MAFESNSSGAAASVFLALYTGYLALAINIVRQKGFRSIYTALLVFGIFRVTGQMCGVVFAVLGIEHYQWLIAYLVFTAEGYFSLILAAFYFIVQCQVKQTGKSWLHKSKAECSSKMERRKSWSFIFHMVLIPANALVISGGSMLTGINVQDMDKEVDKVNTSKALRTTGQVLFFIQTLIVILLLIYIYVKEKVRCCTVYLLFAAAPFLFVRGLFGILSIYISKMNYYQLSNYELTGLTSLFVAYEYCLATTMEFMAASFMISNFYLEKRETSGKVEESDTFGKLESESSSLNKA